MAKPEPQILNEVVEEEDYTEDDDDDSTLEDCNTDDSEEDPTFDIVEEARSSLSKLSLKKSNSRVSKIKDSDKKRKLDFDEVKIPQLNEVDEKSYEKVEEIIQAGQLEKLKIDQCKVYLRKHGLRLTGKKDVLIERIREHLGIINGGGEQKYPVTSFVLNCKGDACTGDVVMFEQKVYEMYNIASRSATGPPCGTRVVAGRIVKESYGAAKQQHTFTIEVLWSKGVKPLPPLHPLLIKGRNLYRLNTMRQRWTNEAERSKALLEKHSRGSLARSTRETRIQEKEMRMKLREQRVERNASSTIHKENQHPRQQLVQNQRPQKHVESAILPNKILTEINQQTTVMPLRNQFTSQMNIIPDQKISVLGNPDKLLNSSIPPSWHGNISEANKQRNHQGFVQSYPSLNSPPRIPPQHLYRKDRPVHFQNQQPSAIICSPPRSPLRNPTQGFVQSYPSLNSPPRVPLQHLYQKDHPVHFQNQQPSAIISSPLGSPVKNPAQQHHCRFFTQRGWCQYGEKCKFLHEYSGRQSFNIPPQAPLRQTSTNLNSVPMRQQLCRHYVGGRCHYGNNCKFLHVNKAEQR